MNKLFFLVPLLYSNIAYPQVKVGEEAPQIEFSYCLDNNDLKNISYEKELTIIDFWATWCAPCIASFPHYNELSEKFKDRANFVSITVEPKMKVERFLKRGKDIKALKLIDKDSITFENFGISQIPKTFVIGENGKILWSGNSKQLTKEVLEVFFDGKNGKEIKNKKKKPEKKKFYERALFSFVVSEADTITGKNYPTGGWSYKPDYTLKYRNNDSLINAIGWFLKINPQTRMDILNPEKAQVKIDLFYKCGKEAFTEYTNLLLPDNKEGNHFLTLMGSVFGFESKIEKRKTTVYEIQIKDQKKLFEAKSIHEFRSGYDDNNPSGIEIINMPISVLSEILEKHLKVPIVPSDKLLDDIFYDFSINCKDYESASESLEKYGLELMITSKEIDFLVLHFNRN